MSSLQNSSSQPDDEWHLLPLNHLVQTQGPSPNSPRRNIYAGQPRQYIMPDGKAIEKSLLNKSHTANLQADHRNRAVYDQSTSLNASVQPEHRSPSPYRNANTPLTPEESPPFRTTRKRSVDIVRQEDRAIDGTTASLISSAKSDDFNLHVCICQPDPKIPRPRNAFILYRQHHQARIISQNPGCANPEISKIIGEQWQSLPLEDKNSWRVLAEEEKLRHQQQYPSYRYQPKRNSRQNSISMHAVGDAGEAPRCQKCGGQTMPPPSAAFPTGQKTNTNPAAFVTPTASSTVFTPAHRNLPLLSELNLESSAAGHPNTSLLDTNAQGISRSNCPNDRNEICHLRPDVKHARYNGDRSAAAICNKSVQYEDLAGSGTPYPSGQQTQLQQSNLPTAARCERLPALRKMISSAGAMGPPPKPHMGYQQCRLSQGQPLHDRSLKLPPLRTGKANVGVMIAADAGRCQTVEEQIMGISFRYKIKVLSQIANAAPRIIDGTRRGPLIAVEGDSAEAANEIAEWLAQTLDRRNDDFAVNLMKGPEIDLSIGRKQELMARYHRLVGVWLGRSEDIVEGLTVKTTVNVENIDILMEDGPGMTSSGANRAVGENYDGSESASARFGAMQSEGDEGNNKTEKHAPIKTSVAGSNDKAGIDPSFAKWPSKVAVPISTGHLAKSSSPPQPLTIIPNYSLHASNTFAMRIPIGAPDPYSPSDHWQWMATQWRSIVGPDMTVYVRDAGTGEPSRAIVEMEIVEGKSNIALFVVTRSQVAEGEGRGRMELEASARRRLGFEAGEWVRGFGGRSAQ